MSSVQVRNQTPFSHFLFRSEDVRDEPFWVAVVRGQFTFSRDRRATYALRRDPVELRDQFLDAPGTSSIVAASSLVPFKPRADVHLRAVARQSAPRASWRVLLTVGNLTKAASVCGPRYWRRGSDDRWTMSEPEPVVEVPLHYELAFGGTFTTPDGEAIRFPANPIGRGFMPEGFEPSGDELVAPQILPSVEPSMELGQVAAVEGFLPIGRDWSPRTERAGTRDAHWLQHRCPKLPEDFDWSFCNAAHPDLVYPDGYLRGDEWVTIEGVSPEGRITTQLPGAVVWMFVKQGDVPLQLRPLVLDTLTIDTEEFTIDLTWRGLFPAVDTAWLELHAR